MVAQKFAEFGVIARGRVHDRPADHRALRIKFGGEAGHAERLDQAAADEVAHGIAPCRRVLRRRQRVGDDVGQYDTCCRAIVEDLVGLRRCGLGFGKARHVGRPAAEQHRYRIALPHRVAILDMLEPRRHMEQIAQRDRAARIAAALPAFDRGGAVKRQLPVGDEEAGEDGGDAFCHRPADQFRFGAEACAITFVNRLAIAQHVERACLADRVSIGEQCIGTRANSGGKRRQRLRCLDRRDAIKRRTEFRRGRGGRQIALPCGMAQRPCAEHCEGGTCQQPFFGDHGGSE